MKKLIICIGILSMLAINACQVATKKSNQFVITDYGAIGDGKTLNTTAIQTAITKASEAGGGTVIIPPGDFVSGSIFLKDNITLHLEAGATLWGSTNIDDYTELTWGHNKDRQPYHLIIAQNAKNVTISGKGIIDGNGEAFWQDYEKDAEGNMIVPRWILAKEKKVSPLIEISGCTNTTITDITVKTGGGWNIHLHDCDIAKIRGVNIINNLYSPNSDGIDITGSYDVIVSDCYIKTCDDAICLKTTPDSRECRRVTVTNCVLETLCVGLKVGCNESFKDMSDVTFSNCVVNKSSRAVGLYIREGAIYENINVCNIVANTNAPLILNRPIDVMVEKRKPESKMGGIRNLTITNVTATTEGRMMFVSQDSGFIENVILRDINITYPMIENPVPMLEGYSSGQFPKEANNPEARRAKACIVLDNVTNFVLDNMIVNWPKTQKTPAAWAHPERIGNGTFKIYTQDYSKARQTELSLVWLRNTKGGYLDAPLANSSDASMKKYDLINSTIKIKE